MRGKRRDEQIRMLWAELTHTQDKLADDIDNLTQMTLHMQATVTRFVDFADPVGLESEMRAFAHEVDQFRLVVSELGVNQDIAVLKRLVDGLIGEVEQMRTQQEQTWALVQHAVIRP